MAEVTAALVAKLRKMTGAGMMDCKKALEATDGDLENAVDWLRQKGLAGNKHEDRAATEGAVEALADGNVAVIVELKCNTDFVAKGADFTELVSAIARAVVQSGDADVAALTVDGETIGDTITQTGNKVGENVTLGKVVRFEAPDDGLVDAYKHVQNERGTIGVLVELGGVDPTSAGARDVAHDIALHISFAAPQYLTRDDVPDDVLAREREVLEAKSRNENVPEDKIEGAVKGRLNGFYKEVVLLDQPSVKDPKVSIGKLLEGLGKGATVTRFARVKAGEE